MSEYTQEALLEFLYYIHPAAATERDHEKKISDILYRYIDRLKDPDPKYDPLDKIVSELIESFEAAIGEGKDHD